MKRTPKVAYTLEFKRERRRIHSGAFGSRFWRMIGVMAFRYQAIRQTHPAPLIAPRPDRVVRHESPSIKDGIEMRNPGRQEGAA